MITVETDDSPGVLGLVVFSTIFLLSLFFQSDHLFARF